MLRMSPTHSGTIPIVPSTSTATQATAHSTKVATMRGWKPPQNGAARARSAASARFRSAVVDDAEPPSRPNSSMERCSGNGVVSAIAFGA